MDIPLPAEGSLGNYRVRAATPGQQPAGDEEMPAVFGDFLVAAYRRPDFRVDATLASDSNIAGARLTGVVTARYLFGAAMGKRPLQWKATRQPLCSPPASLSESFTDTRFVFLGECGRIEPEDVRADQAVLGADGQFSVTLDTPADQGAPYRYVFEGDVEDVSRQRIAGRAGFVVHPAPWYVGVLAPSYFVEQKTIQHAVVPGQLRQGVSGVPIVLSMARSWPARLPKERVLHVDTTQQEPKIGKWNLVSAGEPGRWRCLCEGGYFEGPLSPATGGPRHYDADRLCARRRLTAWERLITNDHAGARSVRTAETRRLRFMPWGKRDGAAHYEREGVRRIGSSRSRRLSSRFPFRSPRRHNTQILSVCW